MKETKISDIKVPKAAVSCFKLAIGLLCIVIGLPVILGILLLMIVLFAMLLA